jgi:hypothetical protein
MAGYHRPGGSGVGCPGGGTDSTALSRARGRAPLTGHELPPARPQNRGNPKIAQSNVLNMLKHWKKGWDAWPRDLRWLIGVVAAVVLALARAWVLFVPAADWLAHQDVGSAKPALLQTARDAARGRLLTLGAGLFAFGALVYTARNYSLSREGQVTDRYTKAVKQLGDKKVDVRLGGIYALERIARDSPKRDHPLRRSPNGPGTASPYCSRSMPSASTARTR